MVQHFKEKHYLNDAGRFVVPLHRRPNSKALGESRSQAVRRFLSLERSLHSKGQFEMFDDVMQEYFHMQHAEVVPSSDLDKSQQEVFYLPMHAVRKESSSTTKIRAVFDASAKSSSGVSLNDTLLVGPTVHSPLIDVLLRFRFHRVALTTDVSRMYRAVELTMPDRDLHRFVWRQSPDEPLQDYRMTRVTFGVSASSFAANMSVKQNSLDHALVYPQAAAAVERSFYVDDGITGADSIEEAIELQRQLQELFAKGGFLLRKWNSNQPAVLQHLPQELRDGHSTQQLPNPDEYTKTLGLEWNMSSDHFRLTVAPLPPMEHITKRILVSEVAKTFDVLGWFAPAIIKVKIVLQRLWELKTGWDDQLPPAIQEVWSQWRSELSLLSSKHLPRCYFPDTANIVAVELHGFSDASEDAYAGVIYLRMMDSLEQVHTSLVVAKTKVAPIKRLTIPRLELCGAHLLAQLLHHVQQVFNLPLDCIFAWTDSTVVLNWLTGSPRRFKTYVGNRVSRTVEMVPPDRWNHVPGTDNPADCASRGLFPSELLDHELWWHGPVWLTQPSATWPRQFSTMDIGPSDEEKEVCIHAIIDPPTALIPLDRFSSFTRLQRVTAWALRFVNNCRIPEDQWEHRVLTHLTVQELIAAENNWFRFSQEENFPQEIQSLKAGSHLDKSSPLISLHPFLDSSGVLRVSGRIQNAQSHYSLRHPVILHGRHAVTRLMIYSEHLRLLHAGPSLVAASLSTRCHVVGNRKAIYSVTRSCTLCRRMSAKPNPQMMGQLPPERLTPGSVFNEVGVDYAGPVYIKYGFVRKPTVVKTYIAVFVCLSVKAVHLELVSDLTTAAFLAALRRFIARRGRPSRMWSDHSTNFVGATNEIKELIRVLEEKKSQGIVSEFCSSQKIEWQFIPERAPHFGGLWEAAVKSMKLHLKRVIGTQRLTFEEFSTILTQVEACLNSRPLTLLHCDYDDIEALTPGHFLIGRPVESLPDPSLSYRSISLLRRWHLCQSIVRHFWQRWSTEYVASLRRLSKWQHPTRNLQVGDMVILQDNSLVPTQWPLARVMRVHTGEDGLVRVATVKTSSGTYKRPVTKLALLLPSPE